MKALDKKRIASFTLTTLVAISLIALPNASLAQAASKDLHMAGPATTTGANTIRSGKGAPTSILGNNGDFYIDALKLNFYGPKVSGRWPSPISMRGPAGATGVAGKVGATGSKGRTGAAGATKAAIGAKGAPGIPGLKGATGAAGLAGSVGATGSTGATGIPGEVGAAGRVGPNGLPGSSGATGTNGSQGAQGAAGISGSVGLTGGAGAQGLQGITGSQGVTGSQGATGLTGGTGAQGATGPSQVQVVLIVPWQLSTTTAGTGNTSLGFGNLAPSKTYEFIMNINGKLAINQSPTYSIRVGLLVQCSDPGSVITYGVSSSFGYSNDGDANTYSKESFVVMGTVATSAANPLSTLSITAIDSGPTTATDAMTLNGSAFIQLVGALT